MIPDREVVVLLASAGRPELLRQVIDDLHRQTFRDFTLVLSVPDDESLPSGGAPRSALVARDRGLAAQRNAGLGLVPDATHVFCFDDDAVVRPDYIEAGLAFFDAHPRVVALTGRVLLDGAAGEAVDRGLADRTLDASTQADRLNPNQGWKAVRELYGCNFAFRPTMLHGEAFDSRLPLYSWLEDHDFCRRAMRHGVIAKVDACVIVHRGVKSGGRTAHTRLGYAQGMNPWYLWHKGSFPLWLALHETVFRFGKNAARSVYGSERAWRRERLRGNMLAFRDILNRKFTPERILTLP